MVIPETVGAASERLARIRPALEKYVGPAKIPGVVTLLARRGEIISQECLGLMDRENHIPMRPDAIFRIYSMTKPIIAVAMLTLYEQGLFHLSDPVSKYIPAFSRLKVYAGQDESGMRLVDQEQEATILDLFLHTSGLTYHLWEYDRVEEAYRQEMVCSTKPLPEFVADLLEMPLAFQPGSAYRYGFSYDVLGHLIEILSGQALDDYLRERLFEPLGMVDTGFYVPAEKQERFTTMYGFGEFLDDGMTASTWFNANGDGTVKRLAGPADCLESAPHNVLRGGVGLVSTAHDYLQFCQMILNQGQHNGQRILGRKTVAMMSADQMPRELLPLEIAGDSWSMGESLGLGFGLITHLGQLHAIGSVGALSWSGAAGTTFWIDPLEEFAGVLLTQLQPHGYYPIAEDFRVLAYQALE